VDTVTDHTFYEDDEPIEKIQKIRNSPPDFITAAPDTWDADEQIALSELARGEGFRFENAEDAIEWLTEDGQP
jgi:hypothetical protein